MTSLIHFHASHNLVYNLLLAALVLLLLRILVELVGGQFDQHLPVPLLGPSWS